MQHIFSFIIVLFYLTTASAQKETTTEILSAKQMRELFSDSVCKNLNINFPIVRIYKYKDKAGQHYCILTESRDEITLTKDTFNHKIKAIDVRRENGSFTKFWEINDNIIENGFNENSIWFWTKYIDFKDYDGDGFDDPIIIYGTSSADDDDDGRLKFIIYHKGHKVAIRHQNGVLDFERETQVDKAFYDLPESLQASIKRKMEIMTNRNQTIFPTGWKIAMKNKKTTFNERR